MMSTNFCLRSFALISLAILATTAPAIRAQGDTTINNQQLSDIITAALNKIAGGGWELDMDGSSSWYQQYFCCQPTLLNVANLPLSNIQTQYQSDPTTTLVYGKYSCETPGIIDTGNACTFSFSTTSQNSVTWSNAKTEGAKVGLSTKWTASIPFTNIGADFSLSAEISFANTDTNGGGTVLTNQATGTCTMPSQKGQAACWQCVMLYRNAQPTIIATASAQLSGYIGVHSFSCTNPTELHQFIPDDGNCHYYRILNVAQLLTLALQQGVITTDDFDINLDQGVALMSSQVTIQATGGYDFQSSVVQCTDPILGQVPDPGTPVTGSLLTSLLSAGSGGASGSLGGGEETSTGAETSTA